MNSSNLLKQTQQLLQQYHLSPRSSRMWGQHFLIDQNVISAIIAAAQIQPGESVLEIGPGLGVLTHALLKTGAQVTAIEQDRRFEKLLNDAIGRDTDFSLVLGNALSLDWASLGLNDREFAIVANLPYSITTPLLEKLTQAPRPTRAVLMIQKDVADRLCAQEHTSFRGALSVLMQLQFTMDVVATVPALAFYPPPKVASAVIRCIPTSIEPPKGFKPFIQEAFRLRRKLLLSNLKRMATHIPWERAFQELSIDLKTRPQDVSNTQWLRLLDFLE